jgi:hypothetical protein
MKALISPSEAFLEGLRIAQVEPDKAIFTVCEPLYWVDCPDECNPTTWFFDASLQQCKPEPIPIPSAEQNKQTATILLQATDWTTIPDIANSELSNPYLENQNEFIAYRNAVRQYAVYPVEGNIDWPVIPQEVWTKT